MGDVGCRALIKIKKKKQMIARTAPQALPFSKSAFLVKRLKPRRLVSGGGDGHTRIGNLAADILIRNVLYMSGEVRSG